MATVPISDTSTRNDYIATASQTTFAYTFWIKDEDHLDVYVNDVLQTLTTDYTVSATQQVAGANVVFNSGLTLSDAVAIVYNPDVERASEFQTSGEFKATALNLELTYLISLAQWFKTKIGRSLQLTDSSALTDLTIADPADNASKFLRVDSGGTSFEYATIADDATVVGGYELERFSGDNAETQFTLSYSPAAQNAISIHVDDVYMEGGIDYTLSGAVITFTVAPSNATNNISVLNLANSVSAAVPSDGSVTTAKLATGDTVTADKIDDDLITNYADTTIATGDEILFSDVDDSNNMKKDTVTGILDLISAYLFGKASVTPASGDSITIYDTDDSDNPKTCTIGDVLNQGTVVQQTLVTTATEQSITTAIPEDNTIPQSSEGAEVFSQSFTPTFSNSKIVIEGEIVAMQSNAQPVAVCLFQDSNTDATFVQVAGGDASGQSYGASFKFIVDASSTSARTYKIRIGQAANTLYINRSATADLYGSGKLLSTLTITEIKQ